MTQQEDKFAGRLADIYKEMEPLLLATAHQLKAPNPRQLVKGWMSRAYVIVDRFDKGELKAKVYKEQDNFDEMENYDPEKHERAKFEQALKHYLRKCFARDILKEFNKQKKHRELQEKHNVADATTSDFSALGLSSGVKLFDYDAITIDHIINLISYDLEKISEESSCAIDVVHQRFLQALLSFCEKLRDRPGPGDWKNLVVVPDIDEPENKKFFAYDFRSEVESGVRKELCRMILKEENPIIMQKLGVLASRDKPAALQKRLFRYFFEKKKGFPERLRVRVKNKTL